MKTIKQLTAVLLSVLIIAAGFAGCSSSEKTTDEITSETMLIAYTEDNAPFIYEEDGQVKGFDAEIIDTVFDSIKNEYKNYKFVKVEADYRLGEDVYCVDADGKDCIAYVMAGGLAKNTGTVNEDYSMTEAVISNKIITVTAEDSEIKTYADLDGKNAGIAAGNGKAALDKHSAVKKGLKSITEYEAGNIENAVNDLKSGKTDALVIDEFTYNTSDISGLKILDGELDTVSYVFAVKKHSELADTLNEAVYELKSPEYNDKDEFTPIVEKYFGYNASDFSYKPVKE